jgi:hypothetical protein
VPLEMKIWKLGGEPKPLAFEPLASEVKLQQLLERDISILSPNLFRLGSQVKTAFGKFIDLLAIDDEGNIVVIELKKDKTPRDAVAQLLDYASWAHQLSYSDITQIFVEKNPGDEFTKAYAAAMGVDAPEELSGDIRLLLVASLLDPESERILNYLSQGYSVPINAVFFRYFRDGESEFLTRSWLIDPSDVEVNLAKTSKARHQELWNGKDFYVAFGEDEQRRWVDAIAYGFISAGGGRRYSRALFNLFEGCRVFVHIPGRGYVGVGTVTGPPQPLATFIAQKNDKEMTLLDAHPEGRYLAEFLDDPEMTEYFVPVDWIKTLPADQAFWKKGMYANQTIATKLKNPTTLNLLREQFGVDE